MSVPRLHSWASLLLDRASSVRFVTPVYTDHHPVLVVSEQDFPQKAIQLPFLQWVPPTFCRYGTVVMLSIWKETTFHLIFSLKCWHAFQTVSSYWRFMWVFLSLPLDQWPMEDSLSIYPHNLLLRHLLSEFHRLGSNISTLVLDLEVFSGFHGLVWC